MDTDFKKSLYKRPNRSFYIITTVFWIAVGSILLVLWNKYSETNFNTARSQIQIVNNYLLTINPADTARLTTSTEALVNSNNETPIDKLFFSIYDAEGNVIFSNTNSKKNITVPSIDELDSISRGGITFYQSDSKIYYDPVLQQECLVTSTYSPKEERFIVSEAPIKDTLSIGRFVSLFSREIVITLVFVLVGILCIALLHRHLRNVSRIKKYLNQLRESNELIEYSDNNRSNVNDIVKELYSLFKAKFDIIKQNDKKREQSIIEEKNKLHSKRILANNLNHEIKTPISIIIGYLDTLINHPSVDNNTKVQFLKKCLFNAQRLQNMVVNIAMINRIEDGSSSIALEETNIWEVAKLVKEDLKFTISESAMTFNVAIEPDTYVKSNEMLLYNIISNLVKNSCFYSGGTSITLKTLRTNDLMITFSFSDNGKGVPEDAIPKLFERFYRLEQDKNMQQGTGLGLPIVKESINLCGGTITVANRPNGGLEYIFSLPKA